MAKYLQADLNDGNAMHALASELFPICRSLTGNGVRKTLNRLALELPKLQIFEVPSGTRCFDWTVPLEWNIEEAYLLGPNGDKVVDFQDNNLHIVGYSIPVDRKLPLDQLQEFLHSIPEQPDAIPYVTSYYKEHWGFCLPDRVRRNLPQGDYRAVIRSSLSQGYLTYAECLIPGQNAQEVFLSTYVCHPSMANNELSGPVVLSRIGSWLESLPERRYTYRLVFIPETIGSIYYLSRHLEDMKSRVIAGFNITCVGDDRCFSYLPTRFGNTISDMVAKHVLKHLDSDYVAYSFLDRGSDERQYCSPGVDLPIASIMRSKYGAYPEYHTSLDDLELVTPSGLQGGYDALRLSIKCLEANRVYANVFPCEPQLGKRGLYPQISARSSTVKLAAMLDLLAYSDGKMSLLEIAERIGQPMWELHPLANMLVSKGVLTGPL